MKVDREFAASVLDAALKKGADQAEVYLKSARHFSVEVKDQEIDALEPSIDFGFSLRVLKDNRQGFSYATDAAALGNVVDNALEASRWTEQDEYLGLPEPAESQSVEIFDDAIALLDEDDAINKAMLVEKSATDFDKRIKKVRKATASFSSKDLIILNSRGLDKKYSATSCSAQIMVVAEDGKDSQMGWDFDGSRFMADISFGEVGKNAAKRALQLLAARKITAMKTHVILDNSVSTEFLGLFASLLSSESVQKGKSLLAGRLGQKVISPVISILDDGCIARRLGSRPFDDEGVATTMKYLIKDGVLLGYMHNVYTAKKDGVKSTGNAVRAFSSLPSVGPSNLSAEILPRHIEKDLIAGLDKGVYITEAMGVHTANPVSGEFSIGISGLWVENGMIKYPVKEAVISGNILDFFDKIEAAGDDLRYYGNIASPSLMVGPVDISA